MSIALKDLTFSVRYMEVMAGLLNERGAPESVLLDALHLTDAQLHDPHQTIDGEQYQRALVAALPYCWPGQSLSAQYLEHVPLTITGPLGLLLMACCTLDEALTAVERYVTALFPAYFMRKEVIKDEVHVVVSRLSDFGEVDDLLTEIVLGMFTKYQPFLAEPLRGFELYFRHQQGPQGMALPGSMISKVHYGALVDKVVFPKRLMAIKVATKSRVMQVEVTRTLDQLLNQDLQAHPCSQQTIRVIRDLMDAGKDLHGDVVAERMGLSRRTLNRRLQEEGNTVAGVTTTVRMSFAETLLLTTSLPMGDIARRAGYSEVTNFSRAFKRVYGCSPSACRDKTG